MTTLIKKFIRIALIISLAAGATACTNSGGSDFSAVGAFADGHSIADF